MGTPSPLKIDTSRLGVADSSGHVQSALERGLPAFTPALVQNDGTMVLCGSGPSIESHIEEIKRERLNGRPIVAVKGAHDFLCGHGIEPDLFVSLEPRDRRRDVQKKNGNTIYLLASRCHPTMFEHLSDCKIVLWHSASTEDENKAFENRGERFLLVGGCSTSGLRALNLGYMMGFRKFVMYGMDSCLSIDGRKRVNGDLAGQTIDVIVDGKTFICNYAMAQQANEFQMVYQFLPGITIESKGDGLLAAIINLRKKMGKHA